jgi:pre-mRNA-processing factor 40
MEHLPEFKALEDDGRRAAFAKYVKRQKERLREASEDGGSATGRRRKEPVREHGDRERDRDYPAGRGDYERAKSGDRERAYREKERDYYSRGKHRDYEREDRRRGSKSEKYGRDWDEGYPESREKRELSHDEKADGRSEKVSVILCHV